LAISLAGENSQIQLKSLDELAFIIVVVVCCFTYLNIGTILVGGNSFEKDLGPCEIGFKRGECWVG
jgi:hypothetical protein